MTWVSNSQWLLMDIRVVGVHWFTQYYTRPLPALKTTVQRRSVSARSSDLKVQTQTGG